MLSAGVVADANVLLSAALGKAALRVFSEHKIPVHTTRFNADEVMEYLPRLSSKYEIPLEMLQLQWMLLPLQIHEVHSYLGQLEEARRLLGDRDPDDAHLLALARTLALPIWSNDSDLSNCGVDFYTTARLLKTLENS
jgi:predicted nucleic acid-binding protein